MQGEPCDWDARKTGHFHCDFLSPGAYQINFEWDMRVLATVSVNAGARIDSSKEVNVELHDYQEPLMPKKVQREGFLQLERRCPPGMEDGFPVVALAWGPSKNKWNSYPGSCTKTLTWPLDAGTYAVSSYRSEFFGDLSTIPFLLQHHGVQVVVKNSRTTNLAVPVLTPDEVIRLALASLQRETQDY